MHSISLNLYICLYKCLYVHMIYGANGFPKLNKNSCSSSSAAQFVYPPINAYQEDKLPNTLTRSSLEGYAVVIQYKMSPPLIFLSS